MPLAVSQSGSAPTTNDPEQKSKLEQNGKKFGKKLGNAGMCEVYHFILTKGSNQSCSNLRRRCYYGLQHREQYLLNRFFLASLGFFDRISLGTTCYIVSLSSLDWRWWSLYSDYLLMA